MEVKNIFLRGTRRWEDLPLLMMMLLQCLTLWRQLLHKDFNQENFRIFYIVETGLLVIGPITYIHSK
jgi:hypothetical protein